MNRFGTGMELPRRDSKQMTVAEHERVSATELLSTHGIRRRPTAHDRTVKATRKSRNSRGARRPNLPLGQSEGGDSAESTLIAPKHGTRGNPPPPALESVASRPTAGASRTEQEVAPGMPMLWGGTWQAATRTLPGTRMQPCPWARDYAGDWGSSRLVEARVGGRRPVAA